MPEFGRKSKFFCFKTSNSQKRLAFLKKIWYTVAVIGYLCPKRIEQERCMAKNAYAERDRVLQRFLCGLYGISLGSGGGQSRQRVTPLYVTFRFCGAREPDLSGTWVVPRSFVPFFGAFFFAFFRFSKTTKKNLYNRRQTP